MLSRKNPIFIKFEIFLYERVNKMNVLSLFIEVVDDLSHNKDKIININRIHSTSHNWKKLMNDSTRGSKILKRYIGESYKIFALSN